ncbi:MAG: hypothetical protein E7480_02915 [Ruminococcaceae bacterium]|nr:hypothetical protein [Oscillospiraceae bacterium]
MKGKIKAYLLSLTISFMLMVLSFALVAVDVQTKDIAGYMGDSAINVFLNNSQKSDTQKNLSDTKKYPTEIFLNIKGIINLFRLITER